jgi:putative DNA primase/helicase
VIRGTDTAIWRRIQLISFSVTIPKGQQDPTLRAKLRDELPGILAWAVEGCLRWQKEGLNPPTIVREATDAYRKEMNPIGAFVADCCVVAEEAQEGASELYQACRRWCEENGESPETQRTFGIRLTELGFATGQATRGTSKGRKVRYGLRLKRVA